MRSASETDGYVRGRQRCVRTLSYAATGGALRGCDVQPRVMTASAITPSAYHGTPYITKKEGASWEAEISLNPAP